MSGGLTDYQASYRRQEMALPALLGVLAFLVAGVFVGIRSGSGDDALSIMLATVGICLLATTVIFVSVFRVHRWTVQPDGILVHERPEVPIAGLPHRTTVVFSDTVAFRRVESGFVRLIEILTRQGGFTACRRRC